MKGTITANDAASLIQRLAESLASGLTNIPVNIDERNNVWIDERVAATIRNRGSA